MLCQTDRPNAASTTQKAAAVKIGPSKGETAFPVTAPPSSAAARHTAAVAGKAAFSGSTPLTAASASSAVHPINTPSAAAVPRSMPSHGGGSARFPPFDKKKPSLARLDTGAYAGGGFFYSVTSLPFQPSQPFREPQRLLQQPLLPSSRFCQPSCHRWAAHQSGHPQRKPPTWSAPCERGLRWFQ